jgi:antitoxin VapB
MALNIKNPEVERLATEVAALANESKTEAIRRALLDRRERLALRRNKASRPDRIEALLRRRIWPQIPRDVLGKTVSREEKEAMLGYGPEGF